MRVNKNSLAYFAYGNGPSLVERQKQDLIQSETSLPERYCCCSSIIGWANPHCQIHGSQQRQDSLTDQMRSVVRWANEHGCYDAADWIRERWGN